ncbi:MAG: hypothetical protein JWO03_941 [Bacteroidetes bacterium]|nr:hypothetical protein [Bacteroidota bacterium]
MNSKDNFRRLTKWIIAIVAIIFILPYVLLGDNCYIRLHDTLEGEWIWLKLMADSHTAFGIYSWVRIPQVMQGIPRNVLPTGLSLNMLLVIWFGMYKAYIISGFIMRLVGFTGMVLVLRDYFVKEPENRYIVYLCALIFCVLPVFIPFGLTVMGQPLLFWAFLNLQDRLKIGLSYAIIALFPFYSSMVWLVVPFEVLLAVAVWYFYKREQISVHLVAGGGLLVVIFILVNLPMLSLSVLNPDFLSHRLGYNLYMLEKPNLLQSIGDFFVLFFFSHYHVATFAPIVVMLALGLTLRKDATLPIILFTAIIVICLFQAFYSYGEYALMNKFAFIKSFRFNRFSILLPLIWVLSFALALQAMRRSAFQRYLVMPFIMAQLFIAVYGNDELLHDYRTLLGHQKFPTFKNYMAADQFTEIRKYINEPVDSYAVASLGISPSIAWYNGMYTLDGLLSIYDLRYKAYFRNIIGVEIDKTPELKQYYDGWGNRCYVFSSELGIKHKDINCSKYDHRSIEHFAFDAMAFKEMGGKYLLSGVEIKNAESTGLHLEKLFTNKDSWWDIYLYSIKKKS